MQLLPLRAIKALARAVDTRRECVDLTCAPSQIARRWQSCRTPHYVMPAQRSLYVEMISPTHSTTFACVEEYHKVSKASAHAFPVLSSSRGQVNEPRQHIQHISHRKGLPQSRLGPHLASAERISGPIMSDNRGQRRISRWTSRRRSKGR